VVHAARVRFLIEEMRELVISHVIAVPRLGKALPQGGDRDDERPGWMRHPGIAAGRVELVRLVEALGIDMVIGSGPAAREASSGPTR
jgi:hypothetical protein